MLKKTTSGFIEKIRAYSGYLFILLFVLLLASFVRNLAKINDAQKKIEVVEERVERLRGGNRELEEKVEGVKKEEYVEGQLRDKLGLAREGETVLVLPDEELLRALAPRQEEEEEVLPDPVWKKWAQLFGL